MDDHRDLSGLRALVTGATAGMGKAVAEALGRHGAEVIVHGRNPERGAAVTGAIIAAGGAARFMAADLNDLAQLAGLAGQAGRVDIFVNNAGFSWFGPTAELDLDHVRCDVHRQRALRLLPGGGARAADGRAR